ncbi:MAG: DUF4136 domain-containing protein [Bacteroidaceae bacterium]|nr:DUF4136 domain-containing protein [Bacteroidales bacterium]MBP3671955.1 DUF4136 domain-containing protein [Bacteroidaceae bacterium]MBQ2979156.1 DUF4136 domain-containing protein [Bacteroidaceae bacterium]
MKKAIPILFLALAFIACQKNPDFNELSSDLIVYTNYDKSATFGEYQTYAIPDSILILDDKEKPSYYAADDPRTIAIVRAINSEMKTRGYIEVDNNADADIGIQVSYVKDTNTIISYASTNPYWWYGYDYYWPGSYWNPYWYGWGPSYAYPISYTYTIGSLIIEMIAIEDANPTTKKIPVIWTAYMAGILSSNQMNINRTVSGIYQAFEQSSYIRSGVE